MLRAVRARYCCERCEPGTVAGMCSGNVAVMNPDAEGRRCIPLAR